MASSGQALDGLRSSSQSQQVTRPLVSLKTPLRLLRSVGSLRGGLGVLLTYLSSENMANVTSSSSDVSNLEPTARTAGKTSSTTSSNRKASRMTSSSKQIPRSVYPVQIAQTEDNALVVEGVGIIETLVSSEISASVATFTAFKTIVVTTVSTSMICTCDNTLSPCELTFHVQFRIG